MVTKADLQTALQASMKQSQTELQSAMKQTQMEMMKQFTPCRTMAIMIMQLTLRTMAIVSMVVDLLIMKVIIRAKASRQGQSDWIFISSMVRIWRHGDAMRHSFLISMELWMYNAFPSLPFIWKVRP
jgi:hypothetical protein